MCVDCPEFRVWFGHNGKKGAIPWPDARNPRSRMLFLISFLVALIPRRPLIRMALLDDLKKALAERALNAEMDHHLANGEAGNAGGQAQALEHRRQRRLG